MSRVSDRRRQQKEDRILNRFVRARLNGAFRSDLEAARLCHAEIELLYRSPGRSGIRPKTFSTIHTYLKRRLAAAGVLLRASVWTPAEDRVVMRFTKALFAGRYEDAGAAARACREALLVERGRHPRSYSRTVPRTKQAVHSRVALFAHRIGVPSPQQPWRPAEDRILTRHARQLVDGRCPSPIAAEQACLKELQRYWDRLRRRSSQRLAVVAGRSFKAVCARLRARMSDLGWCPNRRWTPAERRIVRKWLLRYRRFRESKTPWSIRATGWSLQADLAKRGYRRTVSACWSELHLELRGRIPEDRFRD